MIVSTRAWKRHTKLSLVILSALRLQRQSAFHNANPFVHTDLESLLTFFWCSWLDLGLFDSSQELQGMRTAGTFKVERVLESPQSGAVTVHGGSGCQGIPRDATGCHGMPSTW